MRDGAIFFFFHPTFTLLLASIYSHIANDRLKLRQIFAITHF